MFVELRHDQARQLLDTEQAFSAYSAARHELEERFAGSVGWKAVGSSEYLYRKKGRVQKSLGARSQETEAIEAAFRAGKQRVTERARRLAERLDQLAPVNRALGLGRVPVLTARLVRELSRAGLIGRSLAMVGTNALFAYERLGAVQVTSGLLATADVDLLYDTRVSVKLTSKAASAFGLLGILKKVDPTFRAAARGSFRAVNDDGFMVDLITPAPRDRIRSRGRIVVGDAADDVEAVEIEGLVWLVNAPKIRQVVIDERGYPLELVCPDPRAFALHKLWLSRRDDRDPAKRRRDEAQAMLVIGLIDERLPRYGFDDEHALAALPAALLRLLPPSRERHPPPTDGRSFEPDW